MNDPVFGVGGKRNPILRNGKEYIGERPEKIGEKLYQ
jgi:hypothetical protein